MTIHSDIIVAFISGVLGPILLFYLNDRKNRHKHRHDMIKTTLKDSEAVVSKLEHMRDEFHADRVWISQFHNGGTFYPTGKPMAKLSMIYEVVSIETPSIQSGYQGIPVNIFSKCINELLVHDIVSVPDFDDNEINTFGLKYISEGLNNKSSYLFAIKTINDRFIGVLGVDYTKSKRALDEDELHHLLNHATSLGGVLTVGRQKE